MRMRTLPMLGTVAGLCAATAVALASAGLGSPVIISDSLHMATGNLGTASKATDMQLIGCFAWTADTGNWGICQAMDGTGKSRSCFTSSPNHLQSIRAINGDTHVTFQWNPATGNCTAIMVDNSSNLEPKT